MREKRVFCGILFAVLLMFVLANPAFGEESADEDYIKWVEFNVTTAALKETLALDIETYATDTHLSWIELLAVLACKYGGDFDSYKTADLNKLTERLRAGETIAGITADFEHYDYYFTVYSAVLGEFVGEYRVQIVSEEPNGTPQWESRYGLKAYHPIAAGFSYQHFDDFGMGRNYGYRRRHLGHDLFGAVGTPIVAVESGVVEALGWNQYGGWRVGIRSFDGLRYYYYAHLRQNRPYHCDLEQGQTVKAGDVIGYMGRTGYSHKENTNGIKQTHLHWGLQLIFHPDQKEGTGEIWVDLYALTRLLSQNTSETYRVAETKEFYRTHDFTESNLENKSEL